MKYKCLKVTFPIPLTLDKVDFRSLIESVFIIILDSISPTESGTGPSKTSDHFPLFFTYQFFFLALAPLGHLGHQFPGNPATGKL